MAMSLKSLVTDPRIDPRLSHWDPILLCCWTQIQFLLAVVRLFDLLLWNFH